MNAIECFFFQITNPSVTNVLQGKCRRVLAALHARDPQAAMDGCDNAWILKPAHSCRGRGKKKHAHFGAKEKQHCFIRSSLGGLQCWLVF